jgi:hypothetical protein
VGKILKNPEEKQKKKRSFSKFTRKLQILPQNLRGGRGNHIVAFGTGEAPPCSAAYDLNYDPAGGCDGNHSHFSSLIMLFPITYKP